MEKGQKKRKLTTHNNNNNNEEISDIDETQVTNLILTSRKRSLDLFLRNYSTRIIEDVESQRLRLATKVNDEYAPVRNMPPPPKRAATTETKTKVVTPTVPQQQISSTTTSQQETKILGGHPVPFGPGVALTPDTTASQPELSETGISEILQTLPSKQETKPSMSLIEYKEIAGIGTSNSSGPTGVIARRGLNLEKPSWHPPWKLMRVISGHLGWVRSVAVEPGNEWFATGSADRTIKIWDLASGTLKLTLTGHINCPRGLAVSQRHPYLFSAGEDKMVKCWDLEYNKVIRSYHGHLSAVYCLALHPTIDLLITGGRDSTVRVWDIRTKVQLHCLASHSATVGSLLTQGVDPQVLSGSMDNTVKMWDLAAGKCMGTLTNHKKGVRAMAIHPTEFAFASGSADNIKKWIFPKGSFLQNFSGHNTIIHTLSINNDDVLVSGGDDGALYFWDWKTGYNFQKLTSQVQPGSLDCEAAIYASTFDMSGSRLITCEADKTIKIWKEDTEATEEDHPIDWRPSRAEKRW